MNNKSLVSILMPVYNAVLFLEETLDSILAQTYQNWELIVVNDFSTDNSLSILQQYAEKDNRVQVVQNQNKGIIGALRVAFQNCNGEFITRMDADDKMSSHKLEELTMILQGNGRGVVATGKVKYFSETFLGEGYQKYEHWLNGLIDNQNHFAAIYKECVVPSPCWMLYREDFEACGGFDSDIYPEDYDLVFRFYQSKFIVIGSQEILHFWRDYGERTSRNDDNYADNRFFALKLHYFLKLDAKGNQPLGLWGAGKKGKTIAQLLNQAEIDFTWICNNEKKIGKNIYGKVMQPESYIDSLKNPQIIVAVAGENQQAEILETLRGKETYFFC